MTEPKNRASLKEVQEDYKHSLVRGLLFDLKAAKLPRPETEYVFMEDRDFRFDAAYPEERVAIEVEGGTGHGGGMSRHTTPEGFRKDCLKYNAAGTMGWNVQRFPPSMLRDGTAVEMIGRALKAKRKEKSA